jgi:pimeloyl-ACP methyl ester carboxylesterase
MDPTSENSNTKEINPKQCHGLRADVPTTATSPTAGSHFLSLLSNHKLGYYICGNPSGAPIFYFHGCPSSRLEADDWHKIGIKMNLCIIGVDRPGMGLSTYRPGYTLLDWPHDIEKLAEHLGFSDFRVFGGSGGGPYALACAHKLPLSVLKGTGVLAGMGPPEAGYKGASWDRWFAFNVNRWLPSSMLRFLIEQGIGRPARDRDQKQFRKVVIEGMIGTLPPKDRLLFDPEEMERMISCTRESYITGLDGYVLDAKNMFRRWPFELRNIEAKVLIWNGTEDTFTPIHMARWMANQLPSGSLREFPGDTHNSIFFHRREEVLKDLLSM